MGGNKTSNPFRNGSNPAQTSQGLMALVVMLVLLVMVIIYCCWGSCCNLIRRRRRRYQGRNAPVETPVFGSATSNHIHEHHHHHHAVPAGKSRSRGRAIVPSPPPYEDLFGQELGNPPTYSSLELQNSALMADSNLQMVASPVVGTLHSVRTAAVIESTGAEEESTAESLLIARTSALNTGRVLRSQSVPASIGNSALTAIHMDHHET